MNDGHVRSCWEAAESATALATASSVKSPGVILDLESWRRPRPKTRSVTQIYTSSLYPNLLVVDKEKGARSAPSIAVLGGSLVCAVAADSVVDARALARLARSSGGTGIICSCFLDALEQA